MASCMSHSPSFRRNGGSSLGAEFHEGLAMSLMSVSSVEVFVAGVAVRRGVGISRAAWQWIGFGVLLSSEASEYDPPLPR